MAEQKSVLALFMILIKLFVPKICRIYFYSTSRHEAKEFWAESNGLAEKRKMDRILAYMYLMLRTADLAGLPIRREDFVALGKDLEFFLV